MGIIKGKDIINNSIPANKLVETYARFTDLPPEIQSPADGIKVERTETDVQVNSEKYVLTDGVYVKSDENIIIASADPTHAGAYPAQHYTRVQNVPDNTTQALQGKQATLVSGTNIKTVGGSSVLGTGDIPFPVAPVKATSAQVSAGTDDSTFITPARLKEDQTLKNSTSFLLRFDKTGLSQNVANNSVLNLLTLVTTADATVFNKPLSVWNISGGALKFPTPNVVTPYTPYTVNVRITGTIGGGAGTSREIGLELRRASDSSVVQSGVIIKVAGTDISNRNVLFDTYIGATTDPFVVGGINVVINNVSGQAITLTGFSVIIKGIENT